MGPNSLMVVDVDPLFTCCFRSLRDEDYGVHGAFRV